MGSFNFGCMLSGLSITAGEPVRCLLLTRSPYEENHAHHGFPATQSEWYPRTAPIRGTYNDYGFFDPDEGTEFERSLWVNTLKLDAAALLSRGRTCAIPDTFSFGDLKHFLADGTILLHRQTSFDDREAASSASWRKEAPKGYPTPERVSEALRRADLGGLSAVRLHNEIVSVRPQGYEWSKKEVKLLEQARDLLAGDYAVVIRGTNGHSPIGELLVFFKPGTASCFAAEGEVDPKPTPHLPVSYALIREDVWQWFLSLTADSESYSAGKIIKAKETIEDFRRQLRERYTEMFQAETWVDRYRLQTQSSTALHWMLRTPEIPNTVNPTRILEIIAGQGHTADRPEVGAFLDVAAETFFVWRGMRDLFLDWRPSQAQSQETAHKERAKFHTAMAKIARAAAKQDRED